MACLWAAEKAGKRAGLTVVKRAVQMAAWLAVRWVADWV